MFFLKLIQLVVVIFAVIVLITQVIIPAFKQTKSWPYFDKRRNKTLEELATVKENIEVNSLQQKVETLKKSTESKGENNG